MQNFKKMCEHLKKCNLQKSGDQKYHITLDGQKLTTDTETKTKQEIEAQHGPIAKLESKGYRLIPHNPQPMKKAVSDKKSNSKLGSWAEEHHKGIDVGSGWRQYAPMGAQLTHVITHPDHGVFHLSSHKGNIDEQIDRKKAMFAKQTLHKSKDSKFESCVQQVKDKQGETKVNPWAVCHASLKKAWKPSKDLVPGGKGDNKPDAIFKPKELKMGQKVEQEHTQSPKIAKEIGKDHLSEDKNYYSKLKQAGLADDLNKDNQPHPANSPEDKAHDIVEEGESLSHALQTVETSDNMKRLLEHLR
jgi:hypothetical protein